MIDKRIFYCWFGHGEMSKMNKDCIESWKKVCPDYEIIEINEDNYNIDANPFAKENYEHGNWSAVSDAARLDILKENNGFYLDTDIKLVKSLDELRIYDKGFITEFESGQPDSGILGCGDCFPRFYAEALEKLQPGHVLHKEFIQILYRDFNIHGQPIDINNDGFALLGEEYIPSGKSGLFTSNTIGVHFFENTWVKQWISIKDGFYPYQTLIVTLGNKLLYQDKNPTVKLKLKTLHKKFTDFSIFGRINYFFNPKVIKIVNGEFEAEKLDYNKLATQHTTVTPGGLIVTWID